MTASTKRDARVAGILYLLNGAPAPFSLLYIPSVFTTADKIRSSEFLFRLGIAAELLSATLFIFVGQAMYRLFKGVNERLAQLLLALVLISVPISFANELNRIGALIVATDPYFASNLDPRQLGAVVMAFLHIHAAGIQVVQIFWGLWLVPFGMLAYRSGFMPRVLGVLLILAGVAYVGSSVADLVLPAATMVMFHLSALLGGVGEGATILWLIIVGATAQR